MLVRAAPARGPRRLQDRRARDQGRLHCRGARPSV